MRCCFMLSRVIKLRIAVEVAIFVSATIGLALSAQLQSWVLFSGLAMLSALLFIVLKVSESAPVLKELKAVARRETHLNAAFDGYGVRDLYNMQSDSDRLERNQITSRIIDEGTEFSLSASTAASYISPTVDRHWGHVRRKLADGRVFRLLLTDPFAPSKIVRNSLNHVTVLVDPKLDLAGLRRLNSLYPSLEVRFTQEIYCSVFFTEKEMIYDPYHLGQVSDRLENRFFALRLSEQVVGPGTSYYRQLTNHFNYLWETGASWDSWTAVHSDLVELRNPLEP
jgi:hypothetical protein